MAFCFPAENFFSVLENLYRVAQQSQVEILIKSFIIKLYEAEVRNGKNQNNNFGEKMNNLLGYDKTDPKSIEKYAKKLIGHTFNDVKRWKLSSIVREHILYEDKSRKGGLGNFIEEQFFGYKANSESQADFPEAGVELKVTPYEIKKNGKLSAGERLVLSMISYENEIEPDFYKSHVWEKCKLMLLIYYLRDKSLPSNMV